MPFYVYLLQPPYIPRHFSVRWVDNKTSWVLSLCCSECRSITITDIASYRTTERHHPMNLFIYVYWNIFIPWHPFIHIFTVLSKYEIWYVQSAQTVSLYLLYNYNYNHHHLIKLVVSFNNSIPIHPFTHVTSSHFQTHCIYLFLWGIYLSMNHIHWTGCFKNSFFRFRQPSSISSLTELNHIYRY